MDVGCKNHCVQEINSQLKLSIQLHKGCVKTRCQLKPQLALYEIMIYLYPEASFYKTILFNNRFCFADVFVAILRHVFVNFFEPCFHPIILLRFSQKSTSKHDEKAIFYYLDAKIHLSKI